MVRQPTQAELSDKVTDLSSQLAEANAAKATQAVAFTTLQDTLTQQIKLFNATQARAAAAEAEAQAAAAATAEVQAQAAAAAATAAAAPPPPEEPEAIAKPKVQRYNIREAMNLDDQVYLTIRWQATIHNLMKSAQLNWRDEFRHQDPAKLGHLFKAARKEHPVLRCYVGDWATAVIAKTYMQNMRKYARRRGCIPPWKAGNNANGDNMN